MFLLIGVRYLAELLRRCQRGDTFLFDSYSRTVKRNGNAMRHTVSKVIFRIYRSDRRGHDSFTGRLVLDDGKKIDFATMRDEKLVDQLTKDVADFFGKKVEIEYRSPRLNEVKSLDLTERDIDRK